MSIHKQPETGQLACSRSPLGVPEYLRPGNIFFWDGDGAMSHEDQMRSLRLIGQEVIPAVREMGKELELYSPFEANPATGDRVEVAA